jgi:hypothetical protein
VHVPYLLLLIVLVYVQVTQFVRDKCARSKNQV